MRLKIIKFMNVITLYLADETILSATSIVPHI